MASIHLGACLSGGWRLFKRHPVNHVVAWLLVGVVGSISAGLLIGPMLVGYMRMMAKEDRGESTQLGDLFRGFDDFVPAFVAGLISSLVLWVGFMLCVLPGLLIAALPMVALYLVATGDGDGVAAHLRDGARGERSLRGGRRRFLFSAAASGRERGGERDPGGARGDHAAPPRGRSSSVEARRAKPPTTSR